jgi:hypothetical protein
VDLWHFLGADGDSAYNIWSGFVADFGSLALFGGAIGLYRRHMCHLKGCPRLGKQAVEGTSWVVCHKHHPAGAPDTKQLAEHHRRAVARREATDALLKEGKLHLEALPPDHKP